MAVRRSGRPPAASTVQICEEFAPQSAAQYAMLSPSGVHAGSPLSSGPRVRGSASPPSIGAIQRWGGITCTANNCSLGSL